jgi:hypothetical protein
MSDQNKNESAPKSIDVDKIDLDLMKTKVTDIPALLEYAHTVGGFAIVPTNQGMIKSHAREAMKEQTEEQMAIIYEQMKTLAKQVQDIQKRVIISDLIYNAEIPFTPVIGKTYYLYQRNNQVRFLSLISPKEWGELKEMSYLAEIKLNADHTWKVIHSEIDIGQA